MVFTVFCCTFMNHCNPDSSTKTHISSHTKHVFFNDSSLQKIHISSHPEHAFFHKGSHILSSCSANVAQHLEFVAQHFFGPTNQKKQKTKRNKEFQPWWGLGLVFWFFGFLFVFGFFGLLLCFLVFWFLVFWLSCFLFLFVFFCFFGFLVFFGFFGVWFLAFGFICHKMALQKMHGFNQNTL